MQGTHPADKGPKGAEAVPFGAHLAEASGKTVRESLKPLTDQLLTRTQLDALCAWLNANQTSSLAEDIKKNHLVCFGKPVGEVAPFLRWRGVRFGRDDNSLDYGWFPDDRAVLRG